VFSPLTTNPTPSGRYDVVNDPAHALRLSCERGERPDAQLREQIAALPAMSLTAIVDKAIVAGHDCSARLYRLAHQQLPQLALMRRGRRATAIPQGSIAHPYSFDAPDLGGLSFRSARRRPTAWGHPTIG
jgi:hypothetical protein